MESMGIPPDARSGLAFILADDESAYTAAELARGGDVSSAAISAAVRYLTDTLLVVRERNPAGRGDLFRVRDGHIWGTIQAARLPMLDRIIESAAEAVGLRPPGSAGGARVEETRDHVTFIREDARGLDERWRVWRCSSTP